MSTLGTMVARIHDELTETSLTSQVESAIRSAVAHYQREEFFFTESQSLTVTTSSSQEYITAADYPFIGTLPNIANITLARNASSRWPLNKRTQQYIEDISTNPQSVSEPTDWAYFGQRLRLYPIPDAAYTLILTSDPQQATLSAAADTNSWMVEGEELIRARAKADIEINVLKTPEARAEAGALSGEGYYSILEKIAHRQLLRENFTRASAGVKPNDW